MYVCSSMAKARSDVIGTVLICTAMKICRPTGPSMTLAHEIVSLSLRGPLVCGLATAAVWSAGEMGLRDPEIC